MEQLCKRLLLPGIRMFQENRITVYSGYSTLFIFTAMIPFLILIISVVNLIPGYSAEDVTDILLQILPDLEAVRDFVVTLVSELKNQSGGLLASVAAVTTLWAASKGVMAIQKGLNELDRTEDDRDPGEGERREMIGKGVAYVKRVLERLIFTLMLIIMIPAMMMLEMTNSVIGLIGSYLIIVLAFFAVLQFFAKLPEVNRTLRSQIPGALLTVLCWFVFTELFSFFISKSYRYSSLYGSLAAIFLLVLWIRYMVMILFAGGVLNRVLESGENNEGKEN